MKTLIVGAGIGGLTAALCLHRVGFEVEILEAVREIFPLGVGINLLPHGASVLHRLELGEKLDSVGVKTRAIEYRTKFGHVITSDLRGTGAGFEFPQYSIHRGLLQMILLKTVRERIGAHRIKTGRKVEAFVQNDSGVTAFFTDMSTGKNSGSTEGDILIGADGFHSNIRRQLHPNESPPRYEGMMIWRGVSNFAPFGDGRTMFIAGNHDIKLVCYPISLNLDSSGNVPINWVAEYRQGNPRDAITADWNRLGDASFIQHFHDFNMHDIDVRLLLESARDIFEYPMVDREPLASWGEGRVSLLGDAAHPMYPVGANGASQAILDGEELASSMEKYPPMEALRKYEGNRLTRTKEVVLANRKWGPEKVLDIADKRISSSTDRVEDFITAEEIEEVARAYRDVAGFRKKMDAL